VHFIDAARYDTLLAMSMTHRPIHRLVCILPLTSVDMAV
jgi:hypothetical protein